MLSQRGWSTWAQKKWSVSKGRRRMRRSEGKPWSNVKINSSVDDVVKGNAPITKCRLAVLMSLWQPMSLVLSAVTAGSSVSVIIYAYSLRPCQEFSCHTRFWDYVMDLDVNFNCVLVCFAQRFCYELFSFFHIHIRFGHFHILDNSTSQKNYNGKSK